MRSVVNRLTQQAVSTMLYSPQGVYCGKTELKCLLVDCYVHVIYVLYWVITVS